MAGEVADAAKGMGHAGEAHPVLVRPRLAEAGHAEHDEAGVEGGEHVPAQAPALERAGAKILAHHVRLGGEALEQRVGSATVRGAGGGRTGCRI